MNILVTGGAGYIGSQTAKSLNKAGYTPVVFDNLSSGYRSSVKWGPFVLGTVHDKSALVDVMKQYEIVTVIHFAASAYVGESMFNPTKYFHNNVVGTSILLDAMLEAGIKKLVFSSSCAAYGLANDAHITEDSQLSPVNVYGETKLMCETMARWYGKCHGFNTVSLRYFNAAGADFEGEIGESHQPETHLIPLAIEAALGRRSSLHIFGNDYPTRDGTAIRDYIHVADLADAHVRALKYLLGDGSSIALNLGTGIGLTVRDIVTSVENFSGKKVPVTESPRRAGDPAELLASVELAYHVLGWRARFGLDEIISTAWNWHESQKFIDSV